MKFRFIITIRRADGSEYECSRLANTEEQAVSMVRVPDGETIAMVAKVLTVKED